MDYDTMDAIERLKFAGVFQRRSVQPGTITKAMVDGAHRRGTMTTIGGHTAAVYLMSEIWFLVGE